MLAWVGCAIGVLGIPLEMALENPLAVSGRVNKAKHVSTPVPLKELFLTYYV